MQACYSVLYSICLTGSVIEWSSIVLPASASERNAEFEFPSDQTQIRPNDGETGDKRLVLALAFAFVCLFYSLLTNRILMMSDLELISVQ